MDEIRCRICDSAVCVAAPPNGGTKRGILACGSQVQLENDGTSNYFVCPYCSARNITVVTTARNGQTALQVAWAVMNGE